MELSLAFVHKNLYVPRLFKIIFFHTNIVSIAQCALIICGNPIPWFPKVSGFLNAAAFPRGGGSKGQWRERWAIEACCVHLGTAATAKVHRRGTFVPAIEIISLEKYFSYSSLEIADNLLAFVQDQSWNSAEGAGPAPGVSTGGHTGKGSLVPDDPGQKERKGSKEI